MIYRVSMLIEPKYNNRRPIEEQDAEFASFIEHYKAEAIGHEISQGYIIASNLIVEKIT